jgi:hypothetical protein
LEAETNKYCPGGNDFGAISNLITWVLDFFLSAGRRGDGAGYCRLLCGDSAWLLPAVEARLSLLYTMCVGRNTLIGQNMLKIVESCNEMKRFLLP